MLVLVTGGTGFVGNNIVKALVARGHSVRCLVRHPENVKNLPQNSVELLEGDVKDLQSTSQAAKGVDAAIHLVGIIRETGGQTFESVHVDGTRNVILALKEQGVKRLLHMSALGTREGAQSRYHKSKWQAEQIVKQSGLDWTIFRPSIIVGKGDGFTTTLVDLVKKGPVVPVIGSGNYKLQPIAIEDVVNCFMMALENPEHSGKTYELCGPQALAFNQMLDEVMSALGISKRKVHIPTSIMSPVAMLMESVLPNPPITSDQLIMLREENTCQVNATTQIFGLSPKSFRDRIREFLPKADNS
jgi:NADH dehydrogenase